MNTCSGELFRCCEWGWLWTLAIRNCSVFVNGVTMDTCNEVRFHFFERSATRDTSNEEFNHFCERGWLRTLAMRNRSALGKEMAMETWNEELFCFHERAVTLDTKNEEFYNFCDRRLTTDTCSAELFRFVKGDGYGYLQ